MSQQNLERVCPVCSNHSYSLFAKERINQQKITNFTYSSRKQPEFMCLRLVRCLKCDVVYAPSPPQHDFLQIAYSDAAYDSGLEAQSAAKSYITALKPYLNELKQRTTAFDVGAGNGSLLPLLMEQGFKQSWGIEPSKAAIDAAPISVKPFLIEGMFSKDLVSNLPSPALICSFMTLEHVSDPKLLVETSYDLLTPNGMLAVVVHNWRGTLNRILRLRSPIIDVEHLQLYSPKSIQTLFEQAKFEEIRVVSICNKYPIRYWLRLLPLPNKLKNGLDWLINALGIAEWHMPARVGNILCVGIKKGTCDD